MAQFDVYRLDTSGELLVDCQSDLLASFNTRLVVPLVGQEAAPTPAARLNPIFEIDGTPHVMLTQFAATVPRSELRYPVASLDGHAFAVIGALDVLISGI